jgi:predicted ATPase
VTYVSLAALESADHLVPAIAEGLHVPIQDAHDPRRQLLAYLSRKRMLLVFDNFEHLLEGVDLINEIRGTARDVKLLFTSREPLNVAGEALFHVGGLAYPEDEKKLPADVGDYGAVKLLLNQARLIHPQQGLEAEGMEAISRICKLVQGMPLAIILAAGWLGILSPGEIADEIARGLDLLESEARDIPDRQRSVGAAFDYSWNRLSSAEQDSFMKLAVFRGGFTRQAAGVVTGAGLRRLCRFADISLIDTVGPNRYAIHELLRQFAAEKLEERGLTAATREAHSAY